MKNKLSVILLLFNLIAIAQNPINIGVKSNFLSVLIFEEEINFDLTDIGNPKNYMIIPNETNPKILKIKCLDDRSISKTNLVVFTKNNRVFDILVYVDNNPKKHIHNIYNSFSINTVKGKIKSKSNVVINKPYSYYSDNVITNKEDVISNKTDEMVFDKSQINNICGEVRSGKKRLFKVYGKSGRVSLELNDLLYKEDVLYFALSLKNKGKIRYDLDFINFYTGTNQNESTNQNNELKILHKYLMPDELDGGKSVDFVIALKKFTLNKNKFLFINLGEKEGERDIDLIVDNNLINNPNNLKK